MMELVTTISTEEEDCSQIYTQTSSLVSVLLSLFPVLLVLVLLIKCLHIRIGVLVILLIDCFFSQIHDICRRVSFDINCSSFSNVLNCFRKMLDRFLRQDATGDELTEICRTAAIVPAIECLQAIRFFLAPEIN